MRQVRERMAAGKGRSGKGKVEQIVERVEVLEDEEEKTCEGGRKGENWIGRRDNNNNKT